MMEAVAKSLWSMVPIAMAVVAAWAVDNGKWGVAVLFALISIHIMIDYSASSIKVEMERLAERARR